MRKKVPRGLIQTKTKHCSVCPVGSGQLMLPVRINRDKSFRCNHTPLCGLVRPWAVWLVSACVYS